MKITVLVDMPVEAPALAALQKSGRLELECIPSKADGAQEHDPARLRDTEVLFCTFPPKNFTDLPKLKWVQIASTGYTQLFGLDLTARGIQATNSRGCFDTPIAEWGVAMMVNLGRDFRQMIRNQDAGIWDRSAVFQRELRGLTVGFWGYGGIARDTARLAKQVGMQVHVLARNGVGPRGNVYGVPGTGDPEGTLPDRVFRTGEELAFLGGLDFLVLALPLTKATDGLIGERELRALKPTAYLLNPARGPIIQQEALLKALREKWIAGAALDTHYHYPMPPEHPLWRFPNVIMSPHISGSSLSPSYAPRLWDIFAINVDRYLRGEPLLNILTPDQLAGA